MPLAYELYGNRFYTVSVQLGNTTTAVNLGKPHALLIDRWTACTVKDRIFVLL